MPVIIANTWSEIKAYIDNSKVLLMASTTYCGPCKKFFPILEEVSNELNGLFHAIKVNLDEAPEVNGHLGVGSVPTLIYWKNGKEIYRMIGGCSKKELLDCLNNYLLG